ncbi:alpha/beta hydrolase-fold protein [Pseudoduganella danionis]|uniref:alpha/beta hydrolase-fold protein n=1 Tax=Pseudoduganella danionis TaxID=1890295 RepID=UPI0035B02D94
MPRRLPLSIVLPALLFSGLSATLCAAELPVYSGTLAAKSSREHQLTLQPGDYVQGRLSGNGMRLVLLDKNGQRVRVLSQGKRDTEEFMFVAGAAGPYRLDVRAPQAGDYRLELLQQVPRTAQTVPAQLPDSPRLRALLQQPAGLEAFWAEVRHSSTPLVESTGVTPPLAEHETLVTFLWRGAERGVRLFGGPSADHEELQHLPGTDVWYRSYRLPDSTRLAYRLAPDVPELNAAPHIRRRAILATAQRDPLNPHSSIAAPLDQYDGESLLELPATPAAIWNAPRPGVAAGSLESLRLPSQILGNSREIQLYRPAGWQANDPQRALLVVFDGEHYTRDVPTPVILDNLIASGRLPRTAAIFIHNPSNETRSRELPPNPAFARFLAEELMPWAQARGLSAPASRTVVAGASYGGLAAVWAGYRHPELFGKVYSQSGSFWWAPDWEQAQRYSRPAEWLTEQIANAPRQPLQIHLEAGLFELGRDNQPGIRDTSRHLLHVLQAKGYAASYREYAAAHGYEHWRNSFADGLLQLLGQTM